MALYERIANTGENISRIPVHLFSAGLRELSRGNVTKTDIANAFGLDSTEQSELDSIIDKYNSLSTTSEKENFMVQMHDAFLLAEGGYYSETKVKDVLGF